MSKALLLIFGIIPHVSFARLFQPHWPWELKYNHYFGENSNMTISRTFYLPTKKELEEWKNSNLTEESEPPVLFNASQLLDLPEFDETLAAESFTEYQDTRRQLSNLSVHDLLVPLTSGRRNYYRCKYYVYCFTMNYDWNDDPTRSLKFEKEKIAKVYNLIYAFLFHARYKIKEALAMRDLVRLDKRYRLGYLFNRLRRLAYDQRKIFTSISFVEADYKFRRLHRLLRMFKVIMRYSVDIRDCINHIKDIFYNTPDPYRVTTKSRRPKRSRRSKTTTTTTTPYRPGFLGKIRDTVGGGLDYIKNIVG